MQSILNPRTGKPIKRNVVLVYGFEPKDNSSILTKIPDHYQPYICDHIRDLFTISCVYQFVNPMGMTKEEVDELLNDQL